MIRGRVYYAALLCASLCVVACSGGGGGGGNVAPLPTVTPTPVPTLPPSTTATLTTSTSVPTSVTLGTVTGGNSGSFTVPATNTSATLPSVPSFTFTLGTTPPPNLYVAEYDVSHAVAGWVVVLGPGAVAGNTVTFIGGPPPVTLSSGQTYTFVLFSVPAPLPKVTDTPTPSPTPTATPVPTPQGSPTIAPARVQITSLSTPATVTLSEQGYTGSFAVNAQPCAGIASVAAGPDAFTYILTGIAPGVCAVTFTDQFSQLVGLPVSVTTSAIVVK